ncbi:S-layer homology domain-containing protein [Cohnella silvisoli]|uniref:S-layer homology domain-containing protein n=1 Tax=Cohnella silvisoli TaxID=2873699 RepID=A0ABV1KQI9_9BACL|nr:S-layer homology domain-containing protein [Cohnella silvisoli]MCD9024662.1 S-layer homology domain-containing protein [Cohnella silvisoli]
MMAKKWMALLFAFVLLLPTEAIFRSPEASAAPLFPGSGTAEDPYLISNPIQLDHVRDRLNKNFKLTQNIDLTAYVSSEGLGYNGGQGWNPIGMSESPFSGVFDGDGYVITGLAINRSEWTTGLFRGLTGTIKNLGVVGAQVINQQSDTGILVGQSLGGTIQNCFVKGSVSSSADMAGGLVGANSGTISNSYSLASVSATERVGGLVGYNLDIEEYMGRIENSFAAGQVTATRSTTLKGGLVGDWGTDPNATAVNSFYDKTTSGQSDTGKGIGKDSTEMKMWATYNDAGWDFNSAWFIDEPNDYPTLRVFNAVPTTPDHAPTASPTLTGTAQVGSVLTATSGYADADNDAESGTTYAFYRYDADGITGETLVQGASATDTYTIAAADLGKVIKVKVTPKNAKATGATATSAPTAVIAEAPPILISTAAELDAIRNNLSGNYILTKDIDLTDYLSPAGAGYDGGKGWRPIGTTSNNFTGRFDGNGHVITGLKIDRPNEAPVGFFGRIKEGSSIKRVGLVNVDVKGSVAVGALVGTNTGSVSESFATGKVAASSTFAGGLVGNSTGTIANSYAIVTVNSTSTDVGGLVGKTMMLGPTTPGTVSTSFAAGIVTGTGNTGGLIGTNTGAVDTKSFYDKSISGQSDTNKGIGKTTLEMKTQSTYAGWDFDNVWMMDPNTGYPSLRAFVPADALPTAAPTLTGTAQVGSTLTATSGYADADNDPESGTTFAFYRYGVNGTSNEMLVQEASATNTYTVTVADVGKVIKVKVTPKNEKATGATVTSAPTGVVPRLATEISLVLEPAAVTTNGLKYGSTFKLTATVGPASGTGAVPTGTVRFYMGMQLLGPGELGEDGVATLTVSDWSNLPNPGNSPYEGTLIANYNGISPYDAKSSRILVKVYDKITTKVTLSSDHATATAGQAVKLTALVEANDDLRGVPTGSVTFKNGNTTLGTVTLDERGKAEWTTSALPVGENGDITAVYAGAGDHLGSASSQATVTISPAPSGGSTPTPSGGSAPAKEEIKVDVQSGAGTNGAVVAQTIITRTMDASGKKKDEVSLMPEQANDAVRQLQQGGARSATLVIPDAKDEVAELNVKLPKVSTDKLAGENVGLSIFTNDVHIGIPSGSMQGLSVDTYFHVVPIKQEDERKAVEQRAQTEQAARLAIGTEGVGVIGRPMTIETNMQSRPVELVLPLGNANLTEEQKKDLGVFIEHSDGTKEFVRGELVSYNSSGALGLRITVSKFSTFTIVHLPGWSAALSATAHNPYIFGYGDGTFRPNSAITRAELAAILVRAFPVKSANTALSFADVPDKHWARSAIAQTTAAGLLKGYTDDTFKPDQAITRGEMASIAARLLGGSDANGAGGNGGSLADIKGHWAQASIERVQAAGIIVGYGDGTFHPDDKLTRAQAVVIVNKLLGWKPQASEPAKWTDVPAAHWAFDAIQEASGQAVKH